MDCSWVHFRSLANSRSCDHMIFLLNSEGARKRSFLSLKCFGWRQINIFSLPTLFYALRRLVAQLEEAPDVKCTRLLVRISPTSQLSLSFLRVGGFASDLSGRNKILTHRRPMQLIVYAKKALKLSPLHTVEVEAWRLAKRIGTSLSYSILFDQLLTYLMRWCSGGTPRSKQN